MRFKRYAGHILFGGLFLFSVFTTAFAQEAVSVKVLKKKPNGSYVVVIAGDTMLAITKRMAQKSLKTRADLKTARRALELNDSLLTAYDKVEERYKKVYFQQKEYIAQLENVVKGYKGLLRDYKKLKGEAWLTFEGGVGATGDSNPAVMMGLGIRRLRVWGFMQESNSGGLVGIALPLF